MKKIETLTTGYLLDGGEAIHPIYSMADAYCRLHIWANKRCYHWGIEIEPRYTGLGEGTPKIRECTHIPPNVHTVLKDLPLL